MGVYPTTRVRTAPSPATTGTSLTVAADAGPRFPPTPFTALVWTVGELPVLGTNAEQVEVTARSGDVLTIERGAPAASVKADWMIAVLREVPLVDLNEPVTLKGVFATVPPTNAVLRTRSPQGVVNTSGTVTHVGGGSVQSVLDADQSGLWYYRFEVADEVLPERRFFVPKAGVE